MNNETRTHNFSFSDMYTKYYQVSVDKICSQVSNFAKTTLKNNDTSHDFNHAERVSKNSFIIAFGVGIKDLKALKRIYISSILHDVEDHKYTHQKGIIKKHLKKFGYWDVDGVLKIINNISYTKEKKNFSKINLESKIVQDADRLDALGAIGISRCFVYAGSKSQDIYDSNRMKDKQPDTAIGHFYDKLFKLGDLFKTKPGKLLAQKKIKIMKDFVNNFFEENKPF